MQLTRRTGWSGVRVNCVLAVLLAFSVSTVRAEGERRAMHQAAAVGAHVLLAADGLDLRDARNRPISRAALQRGLRAAGQDARKEAEGLSALAGLAALLDYLDRRDLAADQFSGDFPGRRFGQGSSSWTAPKPPAAPIRKPLLLGDTPRFSQYWHAHALMYETTPGRVRVLELRL